MNAPPPGPWLNIIIHPQSGTICHLSRAPYFWPLEEGFRTPDCIAHTTHEKVWPVPDLKGARLADCPQCSKTGIVPRTAEDAVRYIPGATLKDGVVTIDSLATHTYPRGTGEDEANPGFPMVSKDEISAEVAGDVSRLMKGKS
jgi:hypothetical protein